MDAGRSVGGTAHRRCAGVVLKAFRRVLRSRCSGREQRLRGALPRAALDAGTGCTERRGQLMREPGKNGRGRCQGGRCRDRRGLRSGDAGRGGPASSASRPRTRSSRPPGGPTAAGDPRRAHPRPGRRSAKTPTRGRAKSSPPPDAYPGERRTSPQRKSGGVRRSSGRGAGAGWSSTVRRRLRPSTTHSAGALAAARGSHGWIGPPGRGRGGAAGDRGMMRRRVEK